ncbi:solute carrier family 46 member 3-like [Diorhabda sublineata]|uniref:solute carrier family 46 member 3-like n=1 Tax=Diorhabda sublineata TaxID=1163346 RepID=UPI0024E055DE|nr:solute carrier family 46 member 3-like [Diorhabda sublineata]XP_056639030.1 solute carrier family 46 member 3-like [Diorhabda sublineata]
MSNESETRISLAEDKGFSMVLKHKIDKLRNIITVEPLVGFYQLGLFLTKPALDSLELEKACRISLGYNDTVCNAVIGGNHQQFSDQNDSIQVVVSKMHMWQHVMQSIVPLLLIIFLGTYSDKYKWRRPFFIIPLVGHLIGNIGCMLCVLNMTTWPLEAQSVFQKVVPSICGSQVIVSMATTAYIADVSDVKSRTFRLGVTTIVINISVLLANSISGVVFTKIGYNGVLSVSSLMFILGIIYASLWIKEYQPTFEKNKLAHLFMNMFDPKNAMETITVIFKTKGKSKHLYAMLLFVMIYQSALEGENNLLYLYVQNVFHWTVVDYAYFLTANSAVSVVGNILGLCVFVKVLGAGDLVILFMTVLTKLISEIIFGCAKSSVVFYIGTVAGIVTKLYKIIKRSYATKLVTREDTAKTQSLFSLSEAISPAVAVPLYNLIYVNTLHTFPAAAIFFSVLLYSICCCLVMWMYCSTKIENNNEFIEGEGRDMKTEMEILHM